LFYILCYVALFKIIINMQLEITTTRKKIEKVNYLISLAIDSAKENLAFLKAADLTEKDLDDVESFRKQMLKGYFKI